LEYRSQKKASFATLELTKNIAKPIDRYAVLLNGKDKAGEFYRKSFAGLFSYVSNRIPEITGELYKIDEPSKAGLGWENGPFESWDAIGVEKGIELIKSNGGTYAPWIDEMLAAGIKSFYEIKDGATHYYAIPSKNQIKIPGQDAFIILNNIRENKKV